MNKGIYQIAAGVGAAVGGMIAGRGGAVATSGGAAAAGATLASGSALATAGQFALAAALGYGGGTVVRNMYMTTETGQKFDDFLGEKIAQLWQYMPDFVGGDTARESVEAQAKYDEMIAQQESQNQKIEEQTQLSKDLSNKLSTFIRQILSLFSLSYVVCSVVGNFESSGFKVDYAS